MTHTDFLPLPSQSLTSELRKHLAERTNLRLLRIVRTNLNTQYASQTTSLSGFRNAISLHGTTTSDAVLLEYFQVHVPLSEYESYKPFMSKFEVRPCKESEVANLFAPGLPSFFAISSATSGKDPKLLPRYQVLPLGESFGLDIQGSRAAIYNYGYRETKDVERESDGVVKRIPVCLSSAGRTRELRGWTVDEDDMRMPLILSGDVSPWAAFTIRHHRSFLIAHAIFILACRDVASIATIFMPLLFDLIRYVDAEWDMFVSCIKDGVMPDLEGAGDVQSYLQAHLHPNPERASELHAIGPPLTREGWAAYVWPKLRLVTGICSGPFATTLPKVKTILGPNISIRNPFYGSSESLIAAPYGDSLDLFVLDNHDHIEFLDVTSEALHHNICQAYDLVVGRRYEIILTTNDGLWRYRLGDVIDIVGFDPGNGSPVFAPAGRRCMTIRLPHALVSDTNLLAAVQSISSEIIQVQEFTTMIDDRCCPSTLGFFFEIGDVIGPKSHLIAQSLFEGLVATNTDHQEALNDGEFRLPTIRVLKPGTFTEYRQWISSKSGVGSGQTKVPVIMLNDTSQAWILERVIGEL